VRCKYRHYLQEQCYRVDDCIGRFCRHPSFVSLFVSLGLKLTRQYSREMFLLSHRVHGSTNDVRVKFSTVNSLFIFGNSPRILICETRKSSAVTLAKLVNLLQFIAAFVAIRHFECESRKPPWCSQHKPHILHHIMNRIIAFS